MLDKLKKDIKETMIKRDSKRLEVLRTLMSYVKKVALADNRKVANEDDLKIAVAKEIKELNVSIDMFKKGNRQDLIDNGNYELSIYKEYQIKQISEELVENMIDEVLKSLNVNSKKQMGLVMGNLLKKIEKGSFDIKKLSKMVMSKLQ